jgi:hypothetical protein
LNDGPRLRTLSGYLAWRIAGDAGLALMAEAEAARTNTRSELMVEVFRLAGPTVILLDEPVMFARQLDDIRFEAFLSFIQSLTEAAKMVPGVLIVGSLPESDAEAGGARGREALLILPARVPVAHERVRASVLYPLDPAFTAVVDREVDGDGSLPARIHRFLWGDSNPQPRRFFGSVEIDMVRPVKAFDAILNAVVMELQRSKGAKVRLTLEIEADAEDGFSEADIGVVRDNARQLQFETDSTGFE